MIDDKELDDKIIGVYDSDPRYGEYHSLEDIPKHVMAELKHFFETYKELQLEGREVTVPEILDREKAWEDIELSKGKYKKYRRAIQHKNHFAHRKIKPTR
jgi:inorganic pyrophosphatase